MSIKLKFNGKPFNSSDFMQQMERQIATAVKRKLPDVIAEHLKDESTGEKPHVSIDEKHVERLSNISSFKATISGSKELIANVSDKLESKKT